MDLKELSPKGVPELTRMAVELREELRDLRFKDAQRQLKDVRRIREVKHDIARIETLLTAKRTEKPAHV